MSEHGLVGTYNNQRCRCQKCRAARAAYDRAWRRRNRGKRPFEVPHGYYAYNTYGCRCQQCRDANATRQREFRKRRAAN